MANGVITWNGVASDTLGIVVSKVPSLNRPQRKFNSYSVPGRNGDLVVMQDAYAEYEQEYEIFALDGAQVDARAIVDWLYQDGWCKLADDWEPEYYRMAYFVGPLDIETLISEAAVCTITFRCRPQRFIVEEPITVASGGTITNPTNHVANPIITLTGSGARSLVDLNNRDVVNRNSPPVQNIYGLLNYENPALTYFWGTIENYGGNIYALGYMNNAGTMNELNRTTGAVDFTISTSGYGFGLIQEVDADTDYTVSVKATAGTSKIVVLCADESGYNTISNKYEVEQTLTNADTISLTIHTPVTCGYIVICLFKSSATRAVFSEFRINAGKTVKPFKPYSLNTAFTLTVGNIALQIASTGFDTAVIDCERENVAIDGVDSNNAVTVLDEFGNLSVDFLRIEQGDSLISYDGEITALSIQPRFWEL